jgi:hypothetical protein
MVSIAKKICTGGRIAEPGRIMYNTFMSKVSVFPARQTYVLRAVLKESKPPIWRSLSVPGHFDLEELHIVLQIAFGWENDHMHSFTIGSTEYGMAETMDMAFADSCLVDENTVRLDGLLAATQKFIYLYDFGDSWTHEITVSKVIPVEDGNPPLPCCLDGKRAGPPEDCGGIWGYEEMLEIVKNPDHERYEEIHEWLGDIDPEYFDLEEINTRLGKVFGKKPSAKKRPSGEPKSLPSE